MNTPILYIIAGCNGAGKTTASYSVLPTLLECREFVNADEIAEARVAKRVSEGGHNIPTETIHRRYWLGLQNFFNIFEPIVDAWTFYQNEDTTIKLASSEEPVVNKIFIKLQEVCRNKIK